MLLKEHLFDLLDKKARKILSVYCTTNLPEELFLRLTWRNKVLWFYYKRFLFSFQRHTIVERLLVFFIIIISTR